MTCRTYGDKWIVCSGDGTYRLERLASARLPPASRLPASRPRSPLPGFLPGFPPDNLAAWWNPRFTVGLQLLLTVPKVSTLSYEEKLTRLLQFVLEAEPILAKDSRND